MCQANDWVVFYIIIGASTDRVVSTDTRKSSSWKELRAVLTHVKFSSILDFMQAEGCPYCYSLAGALCETAGQHTAVVRSK